MVATALLLTVLKLASVLDCSWLVIPGIVVADGLIRFVVNSK